MIFLQNNRVSVVESKTENTADREHAAFSTEKPNLGLPIFHHGSSKPTTLSQAKSSERHEKREKQTASPGARRDSVVVTINGEQAKGVVMLLLAINLASLFVSWLQYKYCESFGRHALVGPRSLRTLWWDPSKTPYHAGPNHAVSTQICHCSLIQHDAPAIALPAA